jgi:hypothetical protein
MDPTLPLPAVPAAARDAVVREWLARVLRAYPEQTSRFLLRESDRFRNPVGHALREGLPLLLDELTGGFDIARVTPVLDEIIHIRAVQDFSASEAVGFIFLVKPILREYLTADATLEVFDRRIDEMALLAFDLYMQCREKAAQIRVDEARRRVYLLERTAGWNQ